MTWETAVKIYIETLQNPRATAGAIIGAKRELLRLARHFEAAKAHIGELQKALDEATGAKEAEANLVDIGPGDAAPFEQYLLVTEAATGRRTAMEISDTEPLDIERLIRRFVATAFGGELTVANIFPDAPDDWDAAIITDRRDPDSVVVWESASFYLIGGEA